MIRKITESQWNEIACRYIINDPDFDPCNVVYNHGILGSFEKAYYFCIDNILKTKEENLTKELFSKELCENVSILAIYKDTIESEIRKFSKSGMTNPVAGVIMFNTDKSKFLLCINNLEKYSFPKGKVENLEKPRDAAIREALEETGFDCTNIINEKNYFTFKSSKKHCTYYYVSGVPEDYVFAPQLKGEIKGYKWVSISREMNFDLFTNQAKECIPFLNLILQKWK